MNRKQFLQNCLRLCTASVVGLPKALAQKNTVMPIHISILYSGNLLGQTEATTLEQDKMKSIECLYARAQLIEQIRKETSHCILLDTGNLWLSDEGMLPYTRHSIIQAMNLMGYTACGLGRQEIETQPSDLSALLQEAKFDFLSCNIPGALLNHALKISAYTIVQCDTIKIGIIGINTAEKTEKISVNKSSAALLGSIDQLAAQLKKHKDCQLVVCISQLAQDENEHPQENNYQLAKSSENIDLIISGIKSKNATKPLKVTNKKKKVVWLTQVGTETVYLGRIDYTFFSKKTFFTTNAQTVELLK